MLRTGSFTPRASYGLVLRGTLYKPNPLFSRLNRSIILQIHLVIYDIFVWIFCQGKHKRLPISANQLENRLENYNRVKISFTRPSISVTHQTKNRLGSLRHEIFFKIVAATVIIRIISTTLNGHILFASHLTPDLSIRKSQNCVKTADLNARNHIIIALSLIFVDFCNGRKLF